MSTQPTTNAVPSESPRDLKFNAGKIDEFVTSLALKYQDRFGGEHYTIEGLRWLAQQAIAEFGWIPVGTFQDGATLTLPNQILKDTTDGEYYRWDGLFPKSVPTGSTPSSTGGVAIGAWVGVGDSALRIMLASAQGAGIVGYDRSINYSDGTVGAILKSLPIYPSQFGIRSIEQGATDPQDTKTRLASLCAYAEANKSTVFWPAGTYVFPPNTVMKANNTRWYFSDGCLFKMWDTKVINQDFLIINGAVNQHVNNFTFDANRSVQGDADFGADRCGFIIISPDGCTFNNIRIISSPGKGFGVTAIPNTGIVNNLTIDGVRGGNCKGQAFILDGNNITTKWTGLNYVGNIFIGSTDHAGCAINDGVYNIQFGPIHCETGSLVWDSVSVRDCTDLQFSTTKGKGGTNGCRVFSLNSISKRIGLGDMIGEGAIQSGVLLLQVEDVTGGTVGGINNGAVGLNIAQRVVSGTSYRCKNISISNPVGYDNRATPLQQTGLLVQGCDNFYCGNPLAYGNTSKNVSVNRSVSSNINIPWEKRSGPTTFTLTGGSTVDVSFTWPVSGAASGDTAFETTDYDIAVEVDIASTGAPLCVWGVKSKTVTGCVIQIASIGGSAGTGVVAVRGTRRP